MKETFVRVYDVDKAYGDPEEGGWWYTDYNERESVPVSTMKEAREVFKTLIEKYRQEKDNWDVKGKTAMGYGMITRDSRLFILRNIYIMCYSMLDMLDSGFAKSRSGKSVV